MRQFLAIVHYEFLMQIKSIRFKAMVLLAVLTTLGQYFPAAQMQEYHLEVNLLGYTGLWVYLAAFSVTGLFAIGRTRDVGIHAVLMTKPFSTFTLLLGQMTAAVISLLILLFIMFFPAGLLLRWQYEMEFPLPPVFHVLLFYMFPAMCCTLAMTIWIRTCFKSNITAIVILGIVFAGMLALANSQFLNFPSNEGRPSHNFVPMVSYFSQTYSQSYFQGIFATPYVLFTRSADWMRLGLSVVYSTMFLMLAGYHLRRTEPQRKVLGNYGRRWYHTPTFLKMAFDLKFDPFIERRHHYALAAMTLLIFAKSVWPFLGNDFQLMITGWIAPEEPNASRQIYSAYYNPDKFKEKLILKMHVFDEDTTIGPSQIDSQMTVSLDGDTSGTSAIFGGSNFQYAVNAVKLDGRDLPFVIGNYSVFIKGGDLATAADGARHRLEIIASSNSGATSGADNDNMVWLQPKNFSFYAGIVTRVNAQESSYSTWRPDPAGWPIALTVTVKRQFLPVYEALKPPEFDPTGQLATYHYALSALQSRTRGRLYFVDDAYWARVKVPNCAVEIAVNRTCEEVAKQMLGLAQPVVADFCAVHHLELDQTVHLDTANYVGSLNDIRKLRNMMRVRGHLESWQKDQLIAAVDSFERGMLEAVYWGEYIGPLANRDGTWDYNNFLGINIYCGLNRRMSLSSQFSPLAFSPATGTLSERELADFSPDKTRESELREGRIPVFQLLYWLLGHETWQRMLDRLKPRLRKETFSVTMLRDALAETLAERPHPDFPNIDALDPILDYWLVSGRDLPCYRIEKATARLLPESDDDKMKNERYAVEVTVSNLGTGRMPVQIALSTAKDPIEDRVWIDAGAPSVWKIKTAYMPQEVQVNANGWVFAKPYFDEKSRGWIGNPSMPVAMGDGEGEKRR